MLGQPPIANALGKKMKKSSIAIAFLVLISCSKPGEGPRYEKAKLEAEQVIYAIADYKAKSGWLPKGLGDLSSRNFESKKPPSSVKTGDKRFFYEVEDSATFKFIFSYAGPGKNYCEYAGDLSEHKWDCWGVY